MKRTQNSYLNQKRSPKTKKDSKRFNFEKIQKIKKIKISSIIIKLNTKKKLKL